MQKNDPDQRDVEAIGGAFEAFLEQIAKLIAADLVRKGQQSIPTEIAETDSPPFVAAHSDPTPDPDQVH